MLRLLAKREQARRAAASAAEQDSAAGVSASARDSPRRETKILTISPIDFNEIDDIYH
jgi:hypothetical protein